MSTCSDCGKVKFDTDLIDGIQYNEDAKVFKYKITMKDVDEDAMVSYLNDFVNKFEISSLFLILPHSKYIGKNFLYQCKTIQKLKIKAPELMVIEKNFLYQCKTIQQVIIKAPKLLSIYHGFLYRTSLNPNDGLTIATKPINKTISFYKGEHYSYELEDIDSFDKYHEYLKRIY